MATRRGSGQTKQKDASIVDQLPKMSRKFQRVRRGTNMAESEKSVTWVSVMLLLAIALVG